MHIHIKPFRFSLSNKIQNRNLFLGQASSSPTPNPSQICHNQRTDQEKKNQLCIPRFLVRADVYPIHLHLKNFLGILETYFSHNFFIKMIAI